MEISFILDQIMLFRVPLWFGHAILTIESLKIKFTVPLKWLLNERFNLILFFEDEEGQGWCRRRKGSEREGEGKRKGERKGEEVGKPGAGKQEQRSREQEQGSWEQEQGSWEQ